MSRFPPAGLVALTLACAACLPPAALETGHVAPAGASAVTTGATASATFGKRHDYELTDGSGAVAEADGQHQPLSPIEAGVVGRYARGVGAGLELEVAGWNPLLLPPVGVGGSIGLKAQLLGRGGGPVAVAAGARLAGFAHAFGGGDNERYTVLGLVEGRLAASVDVAPGIALCLVPALRLEGVSDRLDDGETATVYQARAGRTTPSVAVGIALGAGPSSTWLLELDTAFAREGPDGPGFSRWTVGVARRVASGSGPPTVRPGG